MNLIGAQFARKEKRNENKHYILIEEESMYTFKVENVLDRCMQQVVCSSSCAFGRMTNFREFPKNNLISFRPRPSN